MVNKIELSDFQSYKLIGNAVLAKCQLDILRIKNAIENTFEVYNGGSDIGKKLCDICDDLITEIKEGIKEVNQMEGM